MADDAREADLIMQCVSHINRSDLKQSQKNVYKMLLFDAPPQALELLLTLFDAHPDWVNEVYNNYLKKRNLLSQDNPEAWDTFLREEYRKMQGMGEEA